MIQNKDSAKVFFLCLYNFNQNIKLMKEFVAYLIKNLVDQPQAVNVEIIEGEQGTVIEVKVSPEDVGKIVGRQGRTIKALRTITMTVGARVGRRVRLDVVQ